jgi:Replication-relaxation
VSDVPEPPPNGRLAVTPGLLAAIAGRLTARDRWLLAMLHEHRVLTTTHITQLAFGTSRAATARMLTLHRYQLADRFRPLAPAGTAPWHFVLGPAGAHVLAAQYALTPGQLGYRRDRALAVALSPRLGHDTGASGFFTTLAASARRAGDARLACWWSEQRCAALWGDLARPDGYGRWHEHGPAGSAGTDFFLEYDTGAEDLPRLVSKLAGYQALAARTGITTPVLFWLPGPRREAALHARLPAGQAGDLVPVFTATPATGGPAGPAWLPAGQPGRRLYLARLAATLRASASQTAVPLAWPPALAAAPAGLPWHPPDPVPPPAPGNRLTRHDTRTPAG